MSYSYEVGFNLDPKELSDDLVSIPLEKVLGYMKTLFPSQSGWLEARAYWSLNEKNNIFVRCTSEWEDWESLEKHMESSLTEDKVLDEFAEHISKKDLIIRIFEELK